MLFTIGSSKKSAEEFFATLENAKIGLLLDIRLNNKSQLLGFTKGQDLKYFCSKLLNIKYKHEPILAPTKEILKRYRKDKDWALYEKSFINLLKSRAIVDIFNNEYNLSSNICLLCSEPKPQKCHRRLVAEYLKGYNKNITITHL